MTSKCAFSFMDEGPGVCALHCLNSNLWAEREVEHRGGLGSSGEEDQWSVMPWSLELSTCRAGL